MFGAMVQERTRLEDARFIYAKKLWNKDIIAVNTDGVLSSKDIGLKPDKPKKMGQWRLTDVGPAIAESSGNVFHADKRPHGITYESLLTEIEKEPNKSYYSIKSLRLVTLNDIIEEKAEWKQLGHKKEFATSSIDLVKLLSIQKTGATDRVYEKIPQTGRELLDNVYSSGPITIGE
jgi:hypothetical protein